MKKERNLSLGGKNLFYRDQRVKAIRFKPIREGVKGFKSSRHSRRNKLKEFFLPTSAQKKKGWHPCPSVTSPAFRTVAERQRAKLSRGGDSEDHGRIEQNPHKADRNRRGFAGGLREEVLGPR